MEAPGGNRRLFSVAFKWPVDSIETPSVPAQYHLLYIKLSTRSRSWRTGIAERDALDAVGRGWTSSKPITFKASLQKQIQVQLKASRQKHGHGLKGALSRAFGGWETVGTGKIELALCAHPAADGGTGVVVTPVLVPLRDSNIALEARVTSQPPHSRGAPPSPVPLPEGPPVAALAAGSDIGAPSVQSDPALVYQVVTPVTAVQQPQEQAAQLASPPPLSSTEDDPQTTVSFGSHVPEVQAPPAHEAAAPEPPEQEEQQQHQQQLPPLLTPPQQLMEAAGRPLTLGTGLAAAAGAAAATTVTGAGEKAVTSAAAVAHKAEAVAAPAAAAVTAHVPGAPLVQQLALRGASLLQVSGGWLMRSMLAFWIWCLTRGWNELQAYLTGGRVSWPVSTALWLVRMCATFWFYVWVWPLLLAWRLLGGRRQA